MLNCHDATLLASQRCDRPLTFSERMRLRLHLGLCRGCLRFAQQLPQLGNAARALAKGEAPTDQG